MKKYITILITILMVISVFACTADASVPAPAEDETVVEEASEASADTGDRIQIAVVPKAVDNPLNLAVKEAAEKVGEEIGFDVIWTGSSQPDAAAQLQVVEGLIQKKVDGILISPNDPTALLDVINKAIESGIVVATFDSDSPDSNRLFYAGTDNYALGVKCGEVMKELIAETGKDKVQLAILTGVPGAFNLEERIRGFKDGIQGAAAEVEYLPIQACNDDSNKSVEILEQFTPANPDLDAWFIVGGWPFFGSVDTLPNLKEYSDNGGIVLTVDSFYPMLAFVQAGIVHVEVGQDFSAMGDLGSRALIKAINGEEVESFIDTGMIYVDKDNVEEVLANTIPW